MQMTKTGTWEQVHTVIKKVKSYNKKFKDDLSVELNECTDLQRREFLITDDFFKLSVITRRKIARDNIPLYTIIVSGQNLKDLYADS